MLFNNATKIMSIVTSLTLTFVSKVIDKFNVKKATGVDKISVKLMKLGKISLLSQK